MASQQDQADRLLEEALEATGARDPREFYRQRLVDIRQSSPEAYDDAVAYYRDTLVPSIAEGRSDPLPAWTEYGRTLAELLAPGRTVSVDGSGRSEPYEAPVDVDRLVLHLPEARNARALLVGLPAKLSDAQRATYDWLVRGRQRLPA